VIRQLRPIYGTSNNFEGDLGQQGGARCSCITVPDQRIRKYCSNSTADAFPGPRQHPRTTRLRQLIEIPPSRMYRAVTAEDNAVTDNFDARGEFYIR
jgi:hypothetical protein